ncbi:MAG: chemotaxis protein CheD [Clostridiales Family XIII bacterium]|jgi:chemotaxis protein CheD|nr:chemotaxis protein CheD [Clostridiales Family XIII bacterium]
MSEQHIVGISDRKVASAPDVIATYALGSCVGVALYDEASKIGGLAHIMLPDSGMVSDGAVNRMKFADTGVTDLVADMVSRGARRGMLTAKIAGGANMFRLSDDSLIASIGDRNVERVKAALDKLGINIIAEDVGKDYGRTLFFDLATGNVNVQSLGKSAKEI